MLKRLILAPTTLHPPPATGAAAAAVVLRSRSCIATAAATVSLTESHCRHFTTTTTTTITTTTTKLPTDSTSPPPFYKILIANRGEISQRIVRTCQKLGVKTVAIYSTADAKAPFVQAADEAICVGPAASSASYLKVDNVIAAIRATQAEAVHPVRYLTFTLRYLTLHWLFDCLVRFKVVVVGKPFFLADCEFHCHSVSQTLSFF
jgi:hypothetical protein